MAKNYLKYTNLFHYDSEINDLEVQNGIIRVNCIDCLDRTNNVMSIFSSVIVAEMLKKINFYEISFINKEKGIIVDELLALVFQIFGVIILNNREMEMKLLFNMQVVKLFIKQKFINQKKDGNQSRRISQ